MPSCACPDVSRLVYFRVLASMGGSMDGIVYIVYKLSLYCIARRAASVASEIVIPPPRLSVWQSRRFPSRHFSIASKVIKYLYQGIHSSSHSSSFFLPVHYSTLRREPDRFSFATPPRPPTSLLYASSAVPTLVTTLSAAMSTMVYWWRRLASIPRRPPAV